MARGRFGNGGNVVVMETDKLDFMALSLSLTLALTLALTFGPASAQAQAPATPTAQQAADAGARPPPKRKPVKRRSVQQVIEPTPPIVTEGYRPTLTVRPPAAATSPSLAPSPPARMNTCGAGGCFDTNGARYNGGVGNTLLSPKGQLCVQGAVNAQCF
jgi:hypothetical protein